MLCMMEAVEDEFCLLEVLEVLKLTSMCCSKLWRVGSVCWKR